jgi:protein-S-isoprenylcysteine O-methyltransferase Ste14
VRHPGYAGNILAILLIPLLLGSQWSFIPALLCSFFFIVRTYKEDLTLKEELEGYDRYAHHVRHRLLPGIW